MRSRSPGTPIATFRESPDHHSSDFAARLGPVKALRFAPPRLRGLAALTGPQIEPRWALTWRSLTFATLKTCRRSDKEPWNGSGWRRSIPRSADGTEGRIELRQRFRKMIIRSGGAASDG